MDWGLGKNNDIPKNHHKKDMVDDLCNPMIKESELTMNSAEKVKMTLNSWDIYKKAQNNTYLNCDMIYSWIMKDK